MPTCTHSLGTIPIELPATDSRVGRRVLASLLRVGLTAVETLKLRGGDIDGRFAGFARIRGTGPGVSFCGMIDELESALPITLISPFEGSDRVSGAVWPAVDEPRIAECNLAKLRWERDADDLPMHVHEHSDRCIMVLEGRGFFHVSPSSLDRFDGSDVSTIAARERDVFVFTRGIVHTFSTAEHHMTLLSCQLPYLAFDDPRQYTLPRFRWIAREQLSRARSRIDMEWMYAMVTGS